MISSRGLGFGARPVSTAPYGRCDVDGVGLALLTAGGIVGTVGLDQWHASSGSLNASDDTSPTNASSR
jgi:hypothetical protein